jgi:hypothetical protein
MSTAAFSILALTALALVAYMALGGIRDLARARKGRVRQRRRPSGGSIDPGSERRAERRARALLKSIVNREEWEMYRDLGFIRVLGQTPETGNGPAPYGYLIYPHKPIVAYLPESNSLLSEYCVEFRDPEAFHGPKLPDSDDVLAKWMMIKADERGLLHDANMHLPGRQVDPQQVRRDLWRLAEWERVRNRSAARTGRDLDEHDQPARDVAALNTATAAPEAQAS